MNRVALVCGHRALLVNSITDHIEYAAHSTFAYGHRDGTAAIHDFEAALHPFSRAHGDRADPIVAEMLLHFEREFAAPCARHVVFHCKGVVNGGKAAVEFHVHNRADDLNDFSFAHDFKFLLTHSHGGAGDFQKFSGDI